MTSTPHSDPAEPTTPSTVSLTEVVDPNSTEALFQDALAETTTTEGDAAKELFRSRILELRRLQDLVACAEADLAKLRSLSPRELAALAGASSGSYGAKPANFNGAYNHLGGGRISADW